MSTGFRAFQARVVGVHIGPIDTIFTVCALAFLATAALAYFALPADAAPEPASIEEEARA